MSSKINKNKKYTRYIIVSDESTRKGRNYSYFFGGCIVKESEYARISLILNSLKNTYNLHEIKRQKINEYNVDKYIAIIEAFFDYIKSGSIKVRIMYAPNNQLNNYRNGQIDTYEKFYYIFIKNAFSLFQAQENLFLRIFMDELPESLQKNKVLKYYLSKGILKTTFSGTANNKVLLYKSRIEEVKSENHVILQCIDVILGVIDFYLNTNDEEKHSKRGQAKMKLMNVLLKNIYHICPDFTFESSTGYFKTYKSWLFPYKHLVFKLQKIKTPELPTQLQRNNADIR